MKNFCVSKDTINRVKRQTIEWEKIFANHINDKSLVSKIHKELLNSTTKNKPPILKMGKELKQIISPHNIQMVIKQIKRGSTSLHNYHEENANQNHKILLHIHWDGHYGKKMEITRVYKDVEKLEPWVLLAVTKNGAATMENSMVHQKIENKIAMWSSNSTFGYILMRNEPGSQIRKSAHSCSRLHYSKNQKGEATCLLADE